MYTSVSTDKTHRMCPINMANLCKLILCPVAKFCWWEFFFCRETVSLWLLLQWDRSAMKLPVPRFHFILWRAFWYKCVSPLLHPNLSSCLHCPFYSKSLQICLTAQHFHTICTWFWTRQKATEMQLGRVTVLVYHPGFPMPGVLHFDRNPALRDANFEVKHNV